MFMPIEYESDKIIMLATLFDMLVIFIFLTPTHFVFNIRHQYPFILINYKL